RPDQTVGSCLRAPQNDKWGDAGRSAAWPAWRAGPSREDQTSWVGPYLFSPFGDRPICAEAQQPRLTSRHAQRSVPQALLGEGEGGEAGFDLIGKQAQLARAMLVHAT